VGVDRLELIGRRLATWCRRSTRNWSARTSRGAWPGTRRRALRDRHGGIAGAGEPAGDRLDPVAYDGEPALLITGVEIIPTQTVQALRPCRPTTRPLEPQLLALQSLAEAIIATDKDGHITFMNASAEQLTGTEAGAASGKLLEDIVSLVDETERRILGDPVRQALTSGAAVNLSRRAMLLSRANGNERSIELSAAPIRNAAKELIGAW